MIIDLHLARLLLEEDFPEFSDLSLAGSYGGTDHKIFRLGNTMQMRVPVDFRRSAQIEKERKWLGSLRPGLPLDIPQVIRSTSHSWILGYGWSIMNWIDGIPGNLSCQLDTVENARRLASWVANLRVKDTTDGPRPGDHNFHRGNDLRVRDEETRSAMTALPAHLDASYAQRIWDDAMEAVPTHPVEQWQHGDLLPSNVLLQNGSLIAVIDFGGLAVGDSACDLIASWSMFGEHARAAFRECLEVDEASWLRGKGWALTTALVAFEYYQTRSEVMTEQSLGTLNALLCSGGPAM